MKIKTPKFCYTILFFLSLVLLQGGTTGKLKGRVSDARGVSLPGTNVIVENTSLGAAANEDGKYYVLNIAPDSYTVTFSMIGYKTLKMKNVRIQTDLTTELNVQLEETVIEAGEEVTVVAQRPMIQRDATASAAIISSDVIEDSPIETFQAIVQTKAGVTSDAGGALHFRGGRSNEIAYLVDGIPNMNPYLTSLGVDIATNAIQELSILTGSFSAEYGQAMSGIVNIVTKNPGSNYHGSISFMGGDLQTDYDIDNSNNIQEFVTPFDLGENRELEATFSGPVPLLGKLRFFSSLRRVIKRGHLFGLSRYTSYGVERDSTDWKAFALNPSEKTNLQLKLSFIPFSKIKVQYNLLYEDSFWKSYSHSRKYLEDGHYQNFKNALNHMFKLAHQISARNFYTLSYSRIDNKYKFFAYSELEDERSVWGGYYVRDSNYEFYTGGTNNSRHKRTVITDQITGHFTSQFRDQHEVKFGIEAKIHQFDLFNWSISVDRRNEPWEDANGNGEFDEGEDFTDLDGNGTWSSTKDDNGDGIDGNIIIASGAYFDRYQPKPREYSAYIQDKIELEDMVINVGFRWDYYESNGRVALNWNDPSPDSTKVATPKSQISPRFSIAYPVTDRGKLFFSYGHFFQMPPYSRLYHNPDFDVLAGVIKSDIGNADLKPQKTISYELGFEQQVAADAAIYLKAYYKDFRNLLGQRVYILPGGSDSYALFINRDWGSVKGISFSFDKRFATLVSGSVDYTYQVVVGNESDPTRTRRDYRLSIEPQKKVVFLTWDQTHTFRFNLNIGRPGNWRISTIGIIESGYPYTPKDVNELVRIAEENSGRKPTRINLDLNAYKNFKISIGSRIISYRLFLKVYNLLDRRNENYVWDSSGRASYSLGRFGALSTPEWVNRPNWFSRPRLIYLGVALEF